MAAVHSASTLNFVASGMRLLAFQPLLTDLFSVRRYAMSGVEGVARLAH